MNARSSTKLPDKKAIAHKAINVVPDLSAAARRVAGALIDHFNRRTSQCDPSVQRLATMLDLHRATVLRATAELVKAGLFEKARHGGSSHRARYSPQWDEFNRIVAEWDAKMVTSSSARKVASLRPTKSQSCDVEGRSSATQNHGIKPAKKTGADERPATRPPPPEGKRRKGLSKEGRPDPSQRELLGVVPGGRSRSAREAAHEAAKRRISEQLRVRYGDEPDRYFRVLDATSIEMLDQAASAEVAARGSGFGALLDLLAARPPPPTVAA